MPGGQLATEPDQYFYHSDHLGSASWITDANGAPIQHIQYCPYGEPFVDQHPANIYQERFTFTGKERDAETGYHYFGARYLDADLMTGWLSVDPMSDKYPNLSPYNYCAWNPVKLIDLDGNEVGDFFSSDGKTWLGADGKDDGKVYRRVDFPMLFDSHGMPNNYIEYGAPLAIAGTYEYVGEVTNITMEYFGEMFPDDKKGPHIAHGTLSIALHVGDQEFVRGEYESWSGCNMKDGTVRYPLQNGKYTLANRLRSVTSTQKNSYSRDNVCFKIDLLPDGWTNPRLGIQIHPDGDPAGTAGCIGIRENPGGFLGAYQACIKLKRNIPLNVNILGNPNSNKTYN